MSAPTREPRLRPLDNVLIRLEEPPWYAIHRVAVGWLACPTLARVLGDDASLGAWGLSLAGILLSLRIVPAVARRLLPFSDAVQAVWFAERQLGKRYDSYQWRKLFWIGLGLGLSAVASGRHGPPIVLAAACLVSGALGLAVWRIRRVRVRPAAAPAFQPSASRAIRHEA